MMKSKIYLDTSVISAYFDFRKPIRQLITQKWIQYNAKEFEIVISTLVLDEIENNTDHILLNNMLNLINMLSLSVLETDDDILKLADTYRKYILPKEINDTIHIALASYYGLDAIVSWNFRHIVNLKTMKAINDVNREQKHPIIQIPTVENLGGDQYGNL